MTMDSTACNITEVVIVIHRVGQVYVIIWYGNTGLVANEALFSLVHDF